ncbi:thioredoxin family protein [Salipaludibacillus sp. LMS25]|jgi:thiol-disulfide isomerase/thioredoxin|uniref:thioredoxin family protein n=1 Tax=Salipaludibacillus sp. LMS25 TaxID=2924031 RepID=UPI0020D06D3A|nr:thioredoxin family protein [Salipaludibacillus sp. LMS25]UTR15642.1 thioredoxin family protein [Salipaludibacillus sp. LMS25]
MKQITSIDDYRHVISGEGTVVMFSAGWCPDCVVIEPILPELEEKYHDLAFYKVNRDDFIELCQELEVFGIPSFLVFKHGKEVHRFVSKDRKTKEEIDRFLSEAKEK